jgi:betaine-aldehyde dehydrogenase
MIFFTGSASTGKEVAKAAAARLVPVVLELGGKSPMIVLGRRRPARAAHAAVWSGFRHSGQVCIRTERVLVEASVADRFINLAAAEIARLRQAAADAGAARRRRRRRRRHHVRAADRSAPSATSPTPVARGGRVVTGGRAATDLPGRFFAPTLIVDATPKWR